ncbi:putative transcription factor interactor and regulator CCHC(Zn) family protein, partial [Tanacetum coccineum]
HAEFDESDRHVLERLNTSAGNHVKEILLKLNLPDHWILKDGGEDFRHSDTERLSRSDEVLKSKNFKKDATLKLFKSKHQEYGFLSLLIIMSVDDADDSISNNSNKSNESRLSDLKFGDPLFLHSNDTTPTPLINFKLTRTDNYNMWSCAMKFALRNKSKLGFIDGTVKRKSNDHVLANQWDLCNSVVDTYDKDDGSVIFNLHKNINSLNQNGSFLSEYYHNLNSLWKQFDAMISLPPCTCEAAKHYENHANQIKLMQFLMGLDDTYQPIRSNILTREPLPLVKTDFTIVSGEESHRNVTSMNNASKTPSATAFAAKGFHNKNSIKKGMKTIKIY